MLTARMRAHGPNARAFRRAGVFRGGAARSMRTASAMHGRRPATLVGRERRSVEAEAAGHEEAWVVAAIPAPGLRARAAFLRARLMDRRALRAAIPACRARLAETTRAYEELVRRKGDRTDTQWQDDRLGLLLIESLETCELQALELQHRVLCMAARPILARVDVLFDGVVREYMELVSSVERVDADAGGYRWGCESYA